MATDQDKESNHYEDQDCSPESLIKHPLQVTVHEEPVPLIYLTNQFEPRLLLGISGAGMRWLVGTGIGTDIYSAIGTEASVLWSPPPPHFCG